MPAVKKQPVNIIEPYVKIRNLSFSHENRKIFDGINMDIPKGKICAVMGVSGAGKTTLLKLIGGQLRPSCGSVKVDGKEVKKLSLPALYQLRKKMGMLFQSSALLTDLTVFENVAFPIREHSNLTNSMIRSLVLMKLQAVGLRGAQDLMPSQLSGGMARRVALARAIALDPMMLMYDEPFTGQDPISMAVLLKLIKTLNESLHMTSILVSHDVKETASISDYIYIISNGKMISHGTPRQISRTKDDNVVQFMKGLADGPEQFHYPAGDYCEELFQTVKGNNDS